MVVRKFLHITRSKIHISVEIWYVFAQFHNTKEEEDFVWKTCLVDPYSTKNDSNMLTLEVHSVMYMWVAKVTRWWRILWASILGVCKYIRRNGSLFVQSWARMPRCVLVSNVSDLLTEGVAACISLLIPLFIYFIYLFHTHKGIHWEICRYFS